MKKGQYLVRTTFWKLLLFNMALVFTSCGGSQTVAESQQEYEELLQKVEARDFAIENRWATPLGGQKINLMGNSNFIRFEGDSVSVDLPYFGVRHAGGGYRNEGGILFEGPLNNLIIEENPQEREIYLSFDGQQRNENLEFYLTLFPNGTVSTSVNSSQRSNISYRGELQ